MSIYFGISSNAANTLFSSLNASSTDNTSSLYGDYASIKNGSYKKLLRSYYTQDKEEPKATATAKDTSVVKKQMTLLKNDATDLYKASQKLVTGSLKNSEENLKNAKAFVKEYNSLIDATEDTEIKTVKRNIDSIINSTKMNAKMLDRIGITIDSDNKMSLDESIFNEADISELNTLFKGENSYAAGVLSRTTNIYASAVSELNKNSGYDSTGKYSNIDTIGNLYNTLF